MFFSKVWMILLAAAAATAMGLAFVAPKPVVRELSTAQAENLGRAQQNAQLLLRIEARRWVDIARKMATDRELIENVEQATDGVAEAAQVSSKLNNRVVQILSGLRAEQRPKLVVAVDIKGKQVYRMGAGDSSFKPGKDGLVGYPLVQDALRGYRRDDTWNVDGKLYLMAGTPVISRAKGRYVGALLVGEEINDAFARLLKQSLRGTDIAFYLRGKKAGSTVTSQVVERMPTSFAIPARRQEVVQKKRTNTVLLGSGREAVYAIMSPLAGEASAHDAFYAVMVPPTPGIGLPDAMRMLKHKDLAWGQFPWLLLGGGLLAVLVVGLVLSFWETNIPLRRLVGDLRKVSQGELQRLDGKRYSGQVNIIALRVNKALERHQKGGGAAAATETSGVMPAGTASKSKAQKDKPKEVMPPMAAAKEQPQVQPPAMNVVEDEPGTSGELGAGVTPLVGLDPEDAATEIQPTAHFDQAEGYVPPHVSEADRGSRDTELSSPAMQYGGAKHGHGGGDELPFTGNEAPMQSVPSAETLMSSVPENMAASGDWKGPAGGGEDELEQYMGTVYKEFLSVKRQCGEDTSNLTFERFKKKLVKNRKALIERYNCRTVKFQVYIKDGKAALKATPIKE